MHGTDRIDLLGRPASADCCRLHPDNARVFFEKDQRWRSSKIYAGSEVIVVNDPNQARPEPGMILRG